MGGSALGRPAKRLSTPDLSALTAHCLKALTPLFTTLPLPLLALTEKQTHGDLDLLIPYDLCSAFSAKSVKGEDFGLIDDLGGDLGVAPWHPVQGGAKDKSQGKEGEENLALRAWCVGVAWTLGGREWRRSGVKGGIMSVGVPCFRIEGIDRAQLGFEVHGLGGGVDAGMEGGETDGEGKELGAKRYEDEPFYQVDLQLIPPPHLPFTQFARSYGNILLSHLLTHLSPHLKNLGTHLGLHYAPYPGLQAIKVELTTDPREFCDWLGISYARWERGFKDEREMWGWVTEVADGALAGRVWERVAGRARSGGEGGTSGSAGGSAGVSGSAAGGAGGLPMRKSRNGGGKVPGWERFKEWLRESEESPYCLRGQGSETDHTEKAGERAKDEKPPKSTDGSKTSSDLSESKTASSTSDPKDPSAPALPTDPDVRKGETASQLNVATNEQTTKASQTPLPETPKTDHQSPAASIPLPDTPMVEKVKAMTISPVIDLIKAVSGTAPAAESRTVTSLDPPKTEMEVVKTVDKSAETVPLPETPAVGVDSPQSVSPLDAPAVASTQTSTPVVPANPTSMANPMPETIAATTATPPSAPTPTPPNPSKKESALDPSKPAKLCPIAKEAIKRWGKMEEFELLMRERRAEAESMVEARRANVELAKEEARLRREAEDAEAEAAVGVRQDGRGVEGEMSVVQEGQEEKQVDEKRKEGVKEDGEGSDEDRDGREQANVSAGEAAPVVLEAVPGVVSPAAVTAAVVSGEMSADGSAGGEGTKAREKLEKIEEVAGDVVRQDGSNEDEAEDRGRVGEIEGRSDTLTIRLDTT